MLFKSATLNTKPQFFKHNTKSYVYQNEINCDYRFTEMFAYFRVSFDYISQMPTNVYLEIGLPAPTVEGILRVSISQCGYNSSNILI
jgi:hypothetical protein